MNRAGVSFRAAAAADVALIHGAGAAAFGQVFAAPGVGDAQTFLRRTVVDGAARVSARPWSASAGGPGRRSGGPVLPDVAVTDADTRRLHQRVSFAVIGERRSTLANARGHVPDHRRMQWQAPARVVARTG